MRKNATILLLLAGIVLTLAGCQKGTTPSDLTGKAVRFAATSESLSTRTSFTGAGTQDGDRIDEFNRLYLTHERINWKEGDQVMIASDFATVLDDSDTKYATYTVASFTEDGNKSYATLEEKVGTEELFFTDAETYKFWGIYPASFGDGSKLVNAQASYSISSSQAPDTNAEPTTTTVTVGEGADAVTKNLKTFAADMSQAVMLAAAEGQTAQNVDMEFYPGFTAFEFTLNSAYADIILHDIVLKPASASKSLAGSVDAKIKKEKGSTFDITYPEEAKELTYTFPEGTTITKTDYVTFTVFAVPETIEGLTLVFHLGEDGSEEQTATLKMREGNETKDISFTGCKKHYLRGIAVKGGWNFKYLTLDIDVLDWVDLKTTISSGDGVQATQFAVSGADNLRELKDAVVDASTTMNDEEKAAAKEANKAYRQYWVFDAGEEVTVTYKIMMPLVGSWAVEALGDTDSFTVTPTSGTLAGNSASATYITLKINSNASGEKKLYLKTTVTSNGETYNLDSETQLYDMRGYHYFVVNGNVDTE